jgi:restriction system protein
LEDFYARGSLVITFLASFLCLLLGFSIGRWRQRIADNRGEAAIRRVLQVHFSSPAYHLLNNVTLPVEDGTTQIDHILVSRFGVFVLESKHYTGWLYGHARGPQWTQVIYKTHYKFQNPIHQNRKHVLAVSKLLDFLPDDMVHPIVVFTGDAIFKTPRPDGVLALAELQAHIESFDVQVLSDNRLQFCVGRLECSRKALTGQTDIDHAAYLRRKFGDAS